MNRTNTQSNSDAEKRDESIKSDAPTLIWYGNGRDEKSTTNSIVYHTDAEQCIRTIEQSILPLFVIVNSRFATDLLSRIHPLGQVDTIFIFCQSSREEQRCRYLLEHYPKIFDLFSNREVLRDTLDESVQLYRCQSGKDYLRAAEIHRNRNQLNRALTYTHKALDMYRKKLSNPNHPLIARCLNNLGALYDAQGDVNRSFEYYEQAVKIYAHLTPKEHGQPTSSTMRR